MPRSLVRFLTSAASTALLAVVATSALSGDYAIAVPRAVTPEQGRLLHEVVTDLALSDAVASDEIRVVDATTGTTIAVFAVPDDGREEVPNLRRRALAEPLADWTRFVREHLVEGSPSSEIGAIDLPRILAALGQAYADRDPATRELCVLVAGSPLRPDATEPAFDMTQAPLVPSDGLIAGPLNASPFGTADRQGQLRGMRVAFWAFDPPGGWDTGLHEQRVERAWWLHTTAQGGTMTAYGPDADTVLQRFADCEDAPTRTFTWDDTRRVNAMIDPNRSTEVTEEAIDVSIQAFVPPVIDTQPDETGRFGRVVRINDVAFRSEAGLILFDEVRRGTRNPRYDESSAASGQTGVTVSFAGFFTGQRLGESSECPTGANPSGCIVGAPSAPLALDPRSPATFTVDDGANPESPALSGAPRFSGPIAILFDRDVAAVGLMGGHFDDIGSTAIQAFDRDGRLIGGVVNLRRSMEFLALATDDGMPRIAGVGFSLVGREAKGYAVDTIRFALPGQYDTGTGSE